jgi:hypothetical protein
MAHIVEKADRGRGWGRKKGKVEVGIKTLNMRRVKGMSRRALLH